MRICLILFICSCFMLNCGTARSNRVDVDDDVTNDTELSSKDMRAMVQRMAEDILKCNIIKERIKAKKEPVKIAIIKMTDESKDYDFSGYQLPTQIRTKLMKYSGGYVTFIDSEKGKEVAKVDAQEDLKLDVAGLIKKYPYLAKADLVLTGRAYAKRRQSKDTVSKYHNYTFWLTHVKTRLIVWQNDYEVKKASDYGSYGRE